MAFREAAVGRPASQQPWLMLCYEGFSKRLLVSPDVACGQLGLGLVCKRARGRLAFSPLYQLATMAAALN